MQVILTESEFVELRSGMSEFEIKKAISEAVTGASVLFLSSLSAKMGWHKKQVDLIVDVIVDYHRQVEFSLLNTIVHTKPKRMTK